MIKLYQLSGNRIVFPTIAFQPLQSYLHLIARSPNRAHELTCGSLSIPADFSNLLTLNGANMTQYHFCVFRTAGRCTQRDYCENSSSWTAKRSKTIFWFR